MTVSSLRCEVLDSCFLVCASEEMASFKTLRRGALSTSTSFDGALLSAILDRVPSGIAPAQDDSGWHRLRMLSWLTRTFVRRTSTFIVHVLVPSHTCTRRTVASPRVARCAFLGARGSAAHRYTVLLLDSLHRYSTVHRSFFWLGKGKETRTKKDEWNGL